MATKKKTAAPELQLLEPERLVVADLQAHPRNYREHPPEQIAHLLSSMRQHGVYRNVVVARDRRTILAGHGVVQAARAGGLERILAVVLPVEPDHPRALKLVAGDNEIGNLAQVNSQLLADILKDVKSLDVDGLLGTGFDDVGLSGMITDLGEAAGSGNGSESYTRKVVSPIYEPKGDKPELAELCDLTKTRELLAEIKAADLPEEEKVFLRLAAYRHAVFDYERIAEYYAHAPKSTQNLMENSALVIIDFEKAIEKGFVVLSEKIADIYRTSQPDED